MTDTLPHTVDEEHPVVQALVAKILDLERQLQAEQEVSDHWRRRAEEADRRVAYLETERFTR